MISIAHLASTSSPGPSKGIIKAFRLSHWNLTSIVEVNCQDAGFIHLLVSPWLNMEFFHSYCGYFRI